MLRLFNNENDNEILFEILDSLGEGINIVNEKGIILYSNKQSRDYVRKTLEEMLDNHISKFYPQAALINVLKTGKTIKFDNVVHENGEIYKVRAYPIFIKGNLKGGFAIFKDITEITLLNNKLEELELKSSCIDGEDIFSSIVGWDGSLKETILKAKKSIGALGGPRHSIITGESGTGKTMLARKLYHYAKNIGVIKEDAPFIEVNCAQYTNPDIAAMELFGSKEGAYTGSKDKKGLFEIANGGILFLDEAHTLDKYQNLLLKVIESGNVRRVGGVKDIKVNVIVISASTKNLHNVLVPELYQRLAQYELYLSPLRERKSIEKCELLNLFINEYEKSAKERYGINLKINFEPKAQNKLMHFNYSRNIRQFRDVVNASIDSAVPLIRPSLIETDIKVDTSMEDLPIEIIDDDIEEDKTKEKTKELKIEFTNKDLINIGDNPKKADGMIIELANTGLGPRRIANLLNEKGINLKYYQVAYRLKKIRENNIEKDMKEL